MKNKINFLFFIILAFISVLSIGCAVSKNYRDANGVLKTDSRSAVGVHK